ncbi:SDR family NAD(P)-dependent oxidoreductase [Williamsia muralis]|uniref:SDR family NAD(P)-dependent oxidoreductase n=1 Tax=Williamsia marianensis TaxID=85044 RepID=UPI000DE66BA1|nr:SDR family NAD(P)-dependent oxidoreductase [Williamsia marianensis]PVY32472.1 short-subunit dehydrogenase [Williamsia marianensis]
MTATTPTTWFVTGTSRGLGLELVKQLLERGDNVAATTRSTDRLLRALDGVNTDRLLAVALDLTAADAVDAAVRRTIDRFDGLDVVVNNAGYGYLAAVEETTDQAARQMFDVQIFGVWNVLRSVLPIFRSRHGGHIINVSSVLGLTAMPGWGLYCAGKFALEGLSESLAAEVSEFGGKVTIVEPGYFRTDFLTTDSLALPDTTTQGYESIREMTHNHLELQGSQLGDPVKGAAAIIAIAASKEGPLRQLLGSDSYAYATAKVSALTADFQAGRELALTTDHPQT